MAITAATALAVAGCSSAGNSDVENLEVSPDGAYNPQDRDKLEKGGTLTLAIDEVSPQQNYFQADRTAYTNTIWRFYNPQVLLMNGTGEISPNPAYITEIKDEVKDGKTVVTYTINDKAKFNDGTPIDWSTFEHTWKYNNGSNKDLKPAGTDGYELIESVTRGDSDKQAVVTYEQEYPWWQDTFIYLLPNQVNTPELFNEGYINNLRPEWGAGPYKVDTADFKGGTVSFVPNEKWWGNEPLLDKVTFRQMEDQASINAFRAGEIDATGVASKERLASIDGMEDIEIRTSLRPFNALMTLNSEAPNLGEPEVREAIMRGVDREQLAAIRYNGLGYSEDLPGSFIMFQNQDGYEDVFSKVIQFDPEKSKELLDSAGWSEGADGIREKDGEKLTFRYILIGNDEYSKATAGALQKMLRGIGVDLKIEERPSTDFSKITSKRDFDIFLMGFTSTSPSGPAGFAQIYRSDSELNLSGTGNDELDKKIAELAKLPTQEEQIKRSNELEEEAFQEFGILPFANGPVMQATKPKLANFGAQFFAIIPVEDIGWMKE